MSIQPQQVSIMHTHQQYHVTTLGGKKLAGGNQTGALLSFLFQLSNYLPYPSLLPNLEIIHQYTITILLVYSSVLTWKLVVEKNFLRVFHKGLLSADTDGFEKFKFRCCPGCSHHPPGQISTTLFIIILYCGSFVSFVTRITIRSILLPLFSSS